MPNSLVYNNNLKNYYKTSAELEEYRDKDMTDPHDLDTSYNNGNMRASEQMNTFNYNYYYQNLNAIQPNYYPTSSTYLDPKQDTMIHPSPNIKTDEISSANLSDIEVHHNLKSTLSVPTTALGYHSPQNLSNRAFEIAPISITSMQFENQAHNFNYPLVTSSYASYNNLSNPNQFFTHNIYNPNVYNPVMGTPFPPITGNTNIIRNTKIKPAIQSNFITSLPPITTTPPPPPQPQRKRRDPLPKIIPCSFPGCEKKFSRLYNMRAHLEIHSQVRVKPFRCHVCSRMFSRKHDMTRHLKVIHKAL